VIDAYRRRIYHHRSSSQAGSFFFGGVTVSMPDTLLLPTAVPLSSTLSVTPTSSVTLTVMTRPRRKSLSLCFHARVAPYNSANHTASFASAPGRFRNHSFTQSSMHIG
jgi:hypothetical protein